MKRALGPLLALLVGAACSFSPDLSRYPLCAEDGACPSGSTCLVSESRCVPDCGEQSACPAPSGDGGDAGPGVDGGTDAGTDGGPEADAGTDAGTDAGEDGGTDAGTVVALDPDSFSVGVEGAPYSDTVKARGGTPPYSFSATSTLPLGFTLTSEGVLSGTPSMDGTFSIPVRVEDVNRQQSSGSLQLRIRQKLRVAGPGVLADAVIGGSYVETLSVTGGQEPYHFTLASGSALPPGLSLADSGQVTGTASAPESTVRFTVRVTDSSTPPLEATRQLQVSTWSAGLTLLRILTQSLPDARSGTAYRYTLRGHGSSTWSIKAGGQLPPGLVLDSSGGVISGTPQAHSEPATYSFFIVLHGLTTVDQEVSIRVDPRE